MENNIKKIKSFIFNKKNIIIGISIILVIVLIFVFLLIFKDNTLSMDKFINNKKLEKTNKITLIHNEYSFIASKYNLGGKALYESKEDIYLGELKGKILYIRGNVNANIYQVKYNVDNFHKEIPILIQINQYMTSFEEESRTSLKFPVDLKYSDEKLSAESKYPFKLTTEEYIYKENIEYTRTYKYNNVLYDFNYYIEDNYFVCEVVRIL